MAEDPSKSDDKSTPPPPDVAKSTPAPPPPPPKQEAADAPPPAGGEASSSEAAAPADKAAPGTDASIGNRVIAHVLDFLVVIGIGVAVGMVIGFLHLPGILGRLGYLLGVAYILTRDALPFLGGQSVGKKAMRIRAVTLDGKPLTGDWQSSVVRNLLMFIPILALVELIVLLTRQDKPAPLQKLGDEWAKTKVVNEGPPAPAAAASSPPPAPSGPSDSGTDS